MVSPSASGRAAWRLEIGDGAGRPLTQCYGMNRGFEQTLRAVGRTAPPPLPDGFADRIMGRIGDAASEDPVGFGLRILAVSAAVALLISGLAAMRSARSEHLPKDSLFGASAVSFAAESR